MQGVSAAIECAVSGEVRAASGCARECVFTMPNATFMEAKMMITIN